MPNQVRGACRLSWAGSERHPRKICERQKQDALIGLLYREEDASPEIRELKREVESKKAVLQKRRALFPKL